MRIDDRRPVGAKETAEASRATTRGVRRGTAGHVIITEYDPVAIGLVERLRAEAIPYFIVEPDSTKAARFIGEDLSIIAGEDDSRATSPWKSRRRSRRS